MIPLQVLDTKLISTGNSATTLVQVQWSGLPEDWTTWENKARLIKEFPNAAAWGQAAIQGEGNVTTRDQYACDQQAVSPRPMRAQAQEGNSLAVSSAARG